MLAVLQAPVGAQRSEKCLLEGVLGTLCAELATQVRKHDARVLGVERLEGWDRGSHCIHLSL